MSTFRPSASAYPAMRRLAVAATVAAVGLAAAAAAVASALPASAATTTLYASPSGTGTSCSAAQPCSLTAAQAAVRSLNDAMSDDIVVQLADGVYRLSAPLRLTAADSGTNGHTVDLAGRPVGAPGDQRRPGGHRLVARRRRQEHLAGQRRRRDRHPAALRQRRRRHPGAHRR